MPGSSDDVFLAEEESRSFQEQVAFVKTSRISVNSAKRNGSYVGVLYSPTGWPPQASTTVNGVEVGTQSRQQEGSWTGTDFSLLSDQVSFTFEILFDQYSCNQIAEELMNGTHAALVCQLL